MWFEVHELGDDWVDATLTNQPFDIDMRQGDRGRHPLDLLSDWVIFTPADQINPGLPTSPWFLRQLSAGS